jgi:hypothetical protein
MTSILRIQLFKLSATYKLTPDGSIVIERGDENNAVVPVPSAYPDPDPARVVTTLVEMTILRMRQLPSSAKYKLRPDGSIVK